MQYSPKSTLETFQTETLRPIIKSKNDFLLAFFANYKETNKIIFENETDKKVKIEKLLKSDAYIKNIFIGAVISDFNPSGLAIFQENKSEFSKRIISIISKRIFDNY